MNQMRLLSVTEGRDFENDPVLSLDARWENNADLIADLAALEHGWLESDVFDATYNRGAFWSKHRPDSLVTNDINPNFETDHSEDWTESGFADRIGRTFTDVVFDPPYANSGKVESERYGLHVDRTSYEVLELFTKGLENLAPMAARRLFVKCQNQRQGGRYWDQMRHVSNVMDRIGGFDLVTVCHLLSSPRVTKASYPRNNLSHMMVFERATHYT